MANALKELRRAIEIRMSLDSERVQQRHIFHDLIEEAPTSALLGMIEHLKNPDLKKYAEKLSQMRRLIGLIKDRPQDVFSGNITAKEMGEPEADGVGNDDDEEQSGEPKASILVPSYITREKPPKQIYQAQILESLRTSDLRRSIQDILQIISKDFPLDEQKIHEFTRLALQMMSFGKMAVIPINADWNVGLFVGSAYSGWKDIEAWLIPNEKPNFSEDWTNGQLEAVREKIRPIRTNISLVDLQTENVFENDRQIHEVQVFDIGSQEALISTVQEQGWSEIHPEEKDIPLYLQSRKYQVFAHPEQKRVYLLVSNYGTDGKVMHIHIILTPEERKKRDAEFIDKVTKILPQAALSLLDSLAEDATQKAKVSVETIVMNAWERMEARYLPDEDYTTRRLLQRLAVPALSALLVQLQARGFSNQELNSIQAMIDIITDKDAAVRVVVQPNLSIEVPTARLRR